MGPGFVVVFGPGGSAARGERLELLERAEDRAGPGPVGGEVQRGPAGVAGELPGDVEDPVAQSLGFAEPVLALEREQLRPDHDVVRGKCELEPRRVGLEGVERQVARAGCLERLDPVLDLGVLAVGHFELGDVLVVLVGDEALEAMPVQVGERKLGAGVRPFATTDQPSALRPAFED